MKKKKKHFAVVMGMWESLDSVLNAAKMKIY